MSGLSPSQQLNAEVDAGFDAGFMSSEPYIEPAGPLTPWEIGFRHGVKAARDMLAKVFGDDQVL